MNKDIQDEYKPDFMTLMGRSGLMDGLGDTKSLRSFGVEFPGDKIRKACQDRLNQMFVNSYRNIIV
jgi:hypothetical protein